MSKPPFQVGDKVVLAFNVGKLTIVPQLAPSRVYCVRRVEVAFCELTERDQERVELVGVRRNRRCKYVTDDSLPALYFRAVGRLSQRRNGQAKGGA